MSFPVQRCEGSHSAAWNPGRAAAVRPSAWPATARGSNVVWVNFQRHSPVAGDNSSNAAAHLSGMAFQPVLEELAEFARYGRGWDGPGSVSPSSATLAAACKFVRDLSAWATVPEVSLASDGEISVYWNTEDSYVDISFQRSGRVSIYARISGRIYKTVPSSAADFHVPPAVVSHLAPL